MSVDWPVMEAGPLLSRERIIAGMKLPGSQMPNRQSGASGSASVMSGSAMFASIRVPLQSKARRRQGSVRHRINLVWRGMDGPQQCRPHRHLPEHHKACCLLPEIGRGPTVTHMPAFIRVCEQARIYSQRHDLITMSYEAVDIFCLCILSGGHYRDENKGNVGGILNHPGSA